jgi:glutaredoxin
MRPAELTLYSRPGCHLCDDMKAIVAPVARELGWIVKEIDISGQPELESRFGQEIPVLFVGERKAFKYRLTESALRRRLRDRQE